MTCINNITNLQLIQRFCNGLVTWSPWLHNAHRQAHAFYKQFTLNIQFFRVLDHQNHTSHLKKVYTVEPHYFKVQYLEFPTILNYCSFPLVLPYFWVILLFPPNVFYFIFLFTKMQSVMNSPLATTAVNSAQQIAHPF